MKRKKYINRILSFLTVICCLAGSGLGAHTVKAGDVVPERAVFTNEPVEAPDLYITKEVQGMPEYGIPEEETLRFSFTLNLDGKAANNQEYIVIKEDGTEEKEEGRVKIHKAENGKFELGPGETAWFRNLKVGALYEVTEDEMPSDFRQVEPEGNAPVSGIITAKGEERKFVNRYYPEDPGTKVTTLKISKTVSFPDGYTMPETPDFHFILTLDGEAYGMQTYTITNDITGSFAGTGATDADGKFTLKGGYTATFTKVKAGVDYKLEEVEMPEGWRATGNTVLEGATRAPETPLVMNNASASFAVSKQMQDGSKPDVDFTFLLTKEDRSVWTGAKYYLYSTSDGELVEEPTQGESAEQPANPVPGEEQPAEPANPVPGGEPNETIEGGGTTEEVQEGPPTEQPSAGQSKFENPAYTKADGTFTLKAGQTAVFVGIEPGTVYSVSEVGTPDYIQTLPTSLEGYKDYEVSDSVIVLPFINQPVDNSGTLTVTKRVENVKGDAPADQDSFTFKLIKIEKDADGGVTSEKAVEDAIYSLSAGGSTKTYRTGKEEEAGIFTIKANETARFGSLPLGEYKVEEMEAKLPAGYKVSGELAQTEELTEDSSAEFVFTNEYRPDKLDLRLVKENRRNEVLAEISFKLWKVTNESVEGDVWENIEKSEIGTYTTDQDGKFTIPELESGIYYLQETKTTTGYALWKEPLKIEINRSSDRSEMTVKVGGKVVTTKNPTAGDPGATPGETPNGEIVKALTLTQQEGVYDVAELTVINDMLYELPNSGGLGIYVYVLPGVALMIAAIYLYWKRNRLQIG